MAIDEGHDLRSILGLETAIGGRWSHERPKTYSLAALARCSARRRRPSCRA
jgi:hypothetical protein